MFTVIPKSTQGDHRSTPGKHGPKVINHRSGWKAVATNVSRSDEDSLKQQRNELLETEQQYKKRIRVLESEIGVLMKAYEETSEQNKAYVGIIEHGPAAVKVKRLNIDKRELKMKIEKLEEENETLKGAIKGLEKKHRMKHGCGLEDEALRRREDDPKLIQGPFTAKSYIKEQKTAIAINSKTKDHQYNRINSLEQETHMLLNKIHRLKQEKDKISHSLLGKGAVLRNYPIAKALKEKLEGDIDKYEEQLGKLSAKLDSYKMNYDLPSNTNESVEPRSEKITYSPTSKLRDSTIKSPAIKKSRDNNGVPSARQSKEKYASSKSNRQSPELYKVSESSAVKKSRDNNGVPSARQSKEKYASSKSNRQSPELHKVAESGAVGEQLNENITKEQSETDGIRLNSDTTRQTKPVGKSPVKLSSRQSNVSSSSKVQQVTQPNTSRYSNRDADLSTQTSFKLKTSVQPSTSRNSNRDADVPKQTSSKLNTSMQPSTSRHSNRDADVPNQRSVKKGSVTSENTGRYTHGPEPIGYRKQGALVQRKTAADTVQANRSRKRNKFGISRSPYPPIPSADKEETFDEDFNTIHERLRYRALQTERMLRYDSFPTLPNGEILSPIPIRFKENVQVLDRDEVTLLVGKHGLADMDDPEDDTGRRGPWKPY